MNKIKKYLLDVPNLKKNSNAILVKNITIEKRNFSSKMLYWRKKKVEL